MSTEIMVILGVLASGVLVGLMWYGQNKEKERSKKALLVANLSERVHRLQKILDLAPESYLEKDVKLVLLEQIKTRMGKLVELAPSNQKFKKHQDSILSQISDTQSSTAKPPPHTIKTPEEATETKKLLLQLTKTIESLAANKTIPVNSAKKYINNIHQQYTNANINYSIQEAGKSRLENKTKLAVHQYQKIIDDLRKRNQNNVHTEKITQLKEIITAMTGISESDKSEDGGELSKGVNELSEGDEDWKKKYF